MSDCSCTYTTCPHHGGEAHCEDDGDEERKVVLTGKMKMFCSECAAYLEGVGVIEEEEDDEDEEDDEEEEEEEREFCVEVSRTEYLYQSAKVYVDAIDEDDAREKVNNMYWYDFNWETDDGKTDNEEITDCYEND